MTDIQDGTLMRCTALTDGPLCRSVAPTARDFCGAHNAGWRPLPPQIEVAMRYDWFTDLDSIAPGDIAMSLQMPPEAQDAMLIVFGGKPGNPEQRRNAQELATTLFLGLRQAQDAMVEDLKKAAREKTDAPPTADDGYVPDPDNTHLEGDE